MTAKKRAYAAKWFLLILCLSSQTASAANSNRTDLRHRFGMRLTAGGVGYVSYLQRDPLKLSGNSNQTDIVTSITKSVSAGWGVPGKLEFTWLPTNALELKLGFRYTYSRSVMGTDSYGLPYAAFTGFRYYTNPQEPIMAYFSPQVSFQVTHMSVEVGLVWGMQWRVCNVVSLFYELGASAAFIQPKVVENKETIGNDIGGSVSILPVAMGLHFHF
ncbi:MAG: hypothetical protein AAF320_00850 [Myxococcota bacterium]